MPSFFIVKWRWGPVKAPLVFLPLESKYFAFSSDSTYIGPTSPIFSPLKTLWFFLIIKFGEQWA